LILFFPGLKPWAIMRGPGSIVIPAKAGIHVL